MEMTNAETKMDYLKCAMMIGLPVVMQNMVSSLVNTLDVFMLGQLGEVAITASAMSNQWFLLYLILANGIAAASAMFISQFWGKKDHKHIHNYMGILFFGTTALALVFMAVSIVTPERVIRLYSLDEAVIAEGTRYIRIISISFLLYAINCTCATSLRSIGETRIPMLASVVSLLCNTAGNCLLIFGMAGFPRLGIQGAAISTVLARMVELAISLGYICIKKPAVYGPVREYIKIPKEMLNRFFKYGSLVILGELVYAIGNNLYHVAYKYTGTEAQASLQIIMTLQGIALLFCGGFGTAASVMLGTMLGTGEFKKARECSKVLTVFAVLAGVAAGLLVAACSPVLLAFFHIGEEAKENVRIMIMIMALTIPLRTAVYMVICGILRSGGDNVYCFLGNLFGVWFIGLPAVFLTAVVLGLPVYVVYTMAALEEAGKLMICGPRALKGKWLRNLT